MAFKCVFALVALLSVEISWAFPNGGPIDACVAARPNQPNHSGVLSQPEQTSPVLSLKSLFLRLLKNQFFLSGSWARFVFPLHHPPPPFFLLLRV